MKRWVWVLWAVLASLAVAAPGDTGPVTYTLQLIRGTNQAKPESPEWKPIGPKLSERIAPVFRWNHYWEVKRLTVTVSPGKAVRTPLNDDRELELEFAGPALVEMRLYRGGKLARKVRESVDTRMSIMGGDTETGQSWFVVVRGDRPK